MKKTLVYAVFLFLTLGCSTLRTEDNVEIKVREFMKKFEGALSKSDDEILWYLDSPQSRNAVFLIIRMLQDRSNEPFRFSPDFSSPTIEETSSGVLVSIPVTLQGEANAQHYGQITVSFLLSEIDKDEYKIIKLFGEEIFKEVTIIKNASKWSREEKEELKKRAGAYSRAAKLEEQFDSVVWFTWHNGAELFYVVDSTWRNYYLKSETRDQRNSHVKMGLADSLGNLIIPIEYDLIGTIGFDWPNMAEVTRKGRVGLFDVQKHSLIIPPIYDWIIPYESESTIALVKCDTAYGWYDNEFNFFSGLPADSARTWIENFGYLSKKVRLNSEKHGFCEIPSEEYAGNGIFIPPSYLVKRGLFDYIEDDIITTNVPMSGWTDYKVANASPLTKFTDKLFALMSTITNGYVEGRESFYSTTDLVLLNEDRDTVSVTRYSGDEISYSPIGSDLIEVIRPRSHWFGENEVSGEVSHTLIERNYLKITNEKAEKLESKRFYSETEFVKLDSSYLTGNFEIYDHKLNKSIKTNFLSEETIGWMRNDILAAYGYSFPNSDIGNKFDKRWYTPKYNSIAEFRDKMSEIDVHNLVFLDKILSLMSLNKNKGDKTNQSNSLP